MSLPQDLWMTHGKRRLIRRTTANGPYAPPTGTEGYGTVTVPAATKLRGTALTPPTVFTVGQLVVIIPRPNTGSAAAYAALNQLRAVVETVASPVVTFSTAPTDLTGISMTGMVMDVVPLT